MKKLINTLLALVALLPLAGCTHNNGDIGPWFGQWRIESITINGEKDTDYKGNLFFAFQSSVLRISTTNTQTHETGSLYSNWEEVDGYMNIKINEDNEAIRYAAHMYEKEMHMKIEKRSGDKILTYTNSKGEAVTYHLIAW